MLNAFVFGPLIRNVISHKCIRHIYVFCTVYTSLGTCTASTRELLHPFIPLYFPIYICTLNFNRSMRLLNTIGEL